LDLSKLKLDVYDLLGIILPGLIATAEGWILLRGWTAFILSMSHLTGTSLTLLMLFAFGLGHIVQELGDFALLTIKGKRYLRRARDAFWSTEEAKTVRHAIRLELGREVQSVDGAYDYCLTKLKGHFEKRDIFVATSDLCRSLVVLSVVGIAPVSRMTLKDMAPIPRALEAFGLSLAILMVIGLLAWRRMLRYRELSEVTVFRAFLAMTKAIYVDASVEARKHLKATTTAELGREEYMNVLPLTKKRVEERIEEVLAGGQALELSHLHRNVILAFTLPWEQFEEVLADMQGRRRVEMVVEEHEQKYRLAQLAG
jgi:hypothetical protein